MNEDLDDATPAEGPIVDAHGLSPDARGQLTVWSLNAFKHDEDYDMVMLATAMDGTAWVGSCNTKELAQQLVENVGLLLPEEDLLGCLQEALLPLPHHASYHAPQQAPEPSSAPSQPSQPPSQHSAQAAMANHQPSIELHLPGQGAAGAAAAAVGTSGAALPDPLAAVSASDAHLLVTLPPHRMGGAAVRVRLPPEGRSMELCSGAEAQAIYLELVSNLMTNLHDALRQLYDARDAFDELRGMYDSTAAAVAGGTAAGSDPGVGVPLTQLDVAGRSHMDRSHRSLQHQASKRQRLQQEQREQRAEQERQRLAWLRAKASGQLTAVALSGAASQGSGPTANGTGGGGGGGAGGSAPRPFLASPGRRVTPRKALAMSQASGRRETQQGVPGMPESGLPPPLFPPEPLEPKAKADAARAGPGRLGAAQGSPVGASPLRGRRAGEEQEQQQQPAITATPQRPGGQQQHQQQQGLVGGSPSRPGFTPPRSASLVVPAAGPAARMTEAGGLALPATPTAGGRALEQGGPAAGADSQLMEPPGGGGMPVSTARAGAGTAQQRGMLLTGLIDSDEEEAAWEAEAGAPPLALGLPGAAAIPAPGGAGGSLAATATAVSTETAANDGGGAAAAQGGNAAGGVRAVPGSAVAMTAGAGGSVAAAAAVAAAAGVAAQGQGQVEGVARSAARLGVAIRTTGLGRGLARGRGRR